MFDWLNEGARQVSSAAAEHARVLGRDAIGIEHLLLALSESDCRAVAEALLAVNITQADLLTQIEHIATSGGRPPVARTPGAERASQQAWYEARRLGHNYLGPEHQLLGVLSQLNNPWAEPEIAAEILERLGVDLGRLRQEVLSRIPTD